MTKRLSWTTKFEWDVLIAVVVACLPFGIYLHLLFDQTDHSTIQFIGLSYEHGFADSSTFVWSALIRVIPAFLLMTWFLVSSYWWRYFILLPICMNIYSLGKDCISFPLIVQKNEDVVLIVVIIALISILFCFDRVIFAKYRDRNIYDLKSFLVNEKVLFNQIQIQLKKIKTREVRGINYGYIMRLLHLKSTLGVNEKYRSKYMNHKSHQFTRTYELVIIAFLFIITMLPYAKSLIPENESTLKIIWFSIDDNGFNGISNYIWFMAMKISILIPLIIWFYTSRNWWRYALLSPIILFSYQIWEAHQDVQQLDAIGNLKTMPAILIIVFVLIVLSNAYKYRYGLLDIYELLEREIELFVEKAAFKELNAISEFKSMGFENIKGSSSDQYLEELYRLKQRIQLELRANT